MSTLFFHMRKQDSARDDNRPQLGQRATSSVRAGKDHSQRSRPHMRGYMDYLEEQFLGQLGWSIDDSYANVTLNSDNILDFKVPQGAALHLSAQPTPYSFTNYMLNNIELLRGSISYLYASLPTSMESSRNVPLSRLVQCYRGYPTVGNTHQRGTLMFGRMYLPGQQVEGMLIQSLKPAAQLVAKWVVDPRLASPMIMTTTMQFASPKWTREILYSTHENLFGIRTLVDLARWYEREGQSRLVSGMELFYAANKKSPGISAALRYSTYSRYSGVPLTLTLVTNPLFGSVSVAYALKPTALAAFSTRFDFNLYSYLSDLTIGCELWRNSPVSLKSQGGTSDREGPVSVIKASTSLASQTAQILWEGSLRDFVVSAGIKFCYGNRAVPIRMGVEFIYSSQ